MMVLPNGYRWATEAETETGRCDEHAILVHDTEFPEHADTALPTFIPVALEAKNGVITWQCTDEFGDHPFHSNQCWNVYEGMAYTSHPDDDLFDDIEYKNYMYGSSRY